MDGTAIIQCECKTEIGRGSMQSRERPDSSANRSINKETGEARQLISSSLRLIHPQLRLNSDRPRQHADQLRGGSDGNASRSVNTEQKKETGEARLLARCIKQEWQKATETTVQRRSCRLDQYILLARYSWLCHPLHTAHYATPCYTC